MKALFQKIMPFMLLLAGAVLGFVTLVILSALKAAGMTFRGLAWLGMLLRTRPFRGRGT